MRAERAVRGTTSAERQHERQRASWSGSTGAWVPPAVLQVIAWELSMAVALPTSLLVDMPERQQVDVQAASYKR